MKVILIFSFLILIISSKNTFFSVFSEKSKTSALSFSTNQLNTENKYTLKVEKNQNEMSLDFNNKNLLKINSHESIKFYNDLKINSSTIEFALKNDEKIKNHNEKQFILFSFEDFNFSNDWNIKTSKCGLNTILGGYCILSHNEIKKKYKINTIFSEIKINVNFDFFDNWEGESAYMKINEKVVWIDSYNWCDKLLTYRCKEKAINVCGAEFPDRINVPIEIILPLNENEFTLSFGSNIEKNSCEASWGIENIEIYVR